MKTIATTIAAVLFTTGVYASDVYQGLEQGNSDLNSHLFNGPETTGIQPGIGDSFDIYSGLGDGNEDLFKAIDGDFRESERPAIYGPATGNPDL